MAGIQGIDISSDIFSIAKHFCDRNNDLSYMTMILDEDQVRMDMWQFDRLGYDGLDNLQDALPCDDVRYAVVNFNYLSPTDCVRRSKLLFILWAPDEAPVKQKLMATMNYHYVKRQLEGVVGTTLSIQANDYSDLTYEHLIDVMKTKFTCL
jgi:hypothetical protein